MSEDTTACQGLPDRCEDCPKRKGDAIFEEKLEGLKQQIEHLAESIRGRMEEFETTIKGRVDRVEQQVKAADEARAQLLATDKRVSEWLDKLDRWKTARMRDVARVIRAAAVLALGAVFLTSLKMIVHGIAWLINFVKAIF